MKRKTLFLSSLLMLLFLLFSLIPIAPAEADTGTGGGEQRNYDPETGQLALVSGSLAALGALANEISSMSTEQVAEALVNRYAPAFGIRDVGAELSPYRSQQFNGGEVVTFVNRYQQYYRGVPVFGGNMVVNQQYQRGQLVNFAIAGKFALGLNLDVTPTISATEAVDIAKALAARFHNATTESLSASEASLWIYDERLFVTPAMPAQLTWKVDVSGVGQKPFYEVMLINATNGKLAVHYDKLDEWNITKLKNRNLQNRRPTLQSQDIGALSGGSPNWEVYTAGNDVTLPGTLVCNNSTNVNCSYSSVSDPYNDALEAKTHILDTYDFYWTMLGRDSIDGAGMTITATVDFGDPYTSFWWFFNAFWNGTQMVFGDLMTTDDVTAHELTHGVTDYTSGLIYLYQPGAINESLSDVFGELVDLSYAHDRWTNSDVSYRWLVGEDIGEPFGANFAFRSMKKPPAFGDPDSMTRSKYYKGPMDYGGVHTNSGVNNKAAYLMTDGGKFGGKKITGLGIPKVAALYYKVQTAYLFPSASYYDLYLALNAACNAMATTNEAGFTAADCVQVKNATQAVKMHIRPKAITGVTTPVCPPRLYYGQQLFVDDFESGTGAWNGTVNKEGSFSGYIPDTYMGAIGPANNTSLWLTGPAELNSNPPIDYAEEFVTLGTPILLPAGEKIYLTFTHLYLFEAFHWRRYKFNFDGGVLEYSLDGGMTWLDMKPLFNGGVKYNGKVTVGANPNPLAGRLAFVANSRQTPTQMRYNLTKLAGQNFLFRFHAGYDYYTDWGWFIDNVDIHTCTPAPPPPALLSPANKATIPSTNSTVELDWKDVVHPYFGYYRLQVDDNSDFSSPVVDVQPLNTSAYSIPMSSLSPNTAYYWRVASYTPYNQSKGWSAKRIFYIGP